MPPFIVPCTDERLAQVVSLIPEDDDDPPIIPEVGQFVVAPPLYGVWMYDPRDNTQLPVVPGEEGFVYSEVVAADPRVSPPTILDGINAFALEPTLADRGEGVLNIRSVYDFDGGAVADINALADPRANACGGPSCTIPASRQSGFAARMMTCWISTTPLSASAPPMACGKLSATA